MNRQGRPTGVGEAASEPFVGWVERSDDPTRTRIPGCSVGSALRLTQPTLDRGAPGGGVHVTRSPVTPTANAIGLSPPVAFEFPRAMGGLSPWRSVLPPRGGGGARGTVACCKEVAA
jgi:hypothetical protein